MTRSTAFAEKGQDRNGQRLKTNTVLVCGISGVPALACMRRNGGAQSPRGGPGVDHVCVAWMADIFIFISVAPYKLPTATVHSAGQGTLRSSPGHGGARTTRDNRATTFPRGSFFSFLHCVRDPGFIGGPFDKQLAPFRIHALVQRHAHGVHLRYRRVEMSFEVPVRSERFTDMASPAIFGV